MVLALVVEVAWSPFGFLLGFFAVLVIARIVAYAARWNSLNPLWRAIDAMINPVLRITSYNVCYTKLLRRSGRA